MPALEKILIFAQVLKVVGPNRGLQTHSMKHYPAAENIPETGLDILDEIDTGDNLSENDALILYNSASFDCGGCRKNHSK